jgi:hypothetical protein
MELARKVRRSKCSDMASKRRDTTSVNGHYEKHSSNFRCAVRAQPELVSAFWGCLARRGDPGRQRSRRGPKELKSRQQTSGAPTIILEGADAGNWGKLISSVEHDSPAKAKSKDRIASTCQYISTNT